MVLGDGDGDGHCKDIDRLMGGGQAKENVSQGWESGWEMTKKIGNLPKEASLLSNVARPPATLS